MPFGVVIANFEERISNTFSISDHATHPRSIRTPIQIDNLSSASAFLRHHILFQYLEFRKRQYRHGGKSSVVVCRGHR